MNFKQWFEAEEVPHPFEKWHGTYTVARNNEIQARRSTFRPWGVAKPYTSDEMLKQAPQISTVLVADLDGDSSGVHGFGDQEDIPADDACAHAKWEFHINASQEKMLMGQRGFVIDSSGGSFHERWCRMQFHVIVPKELHQRYDYDELPSSTFYGQGYRQKHHNIKRFFRFEGLRKLVEMAQEMEPNMAYPVGDGEDREAYWSRIMGEFPQAPDQGGYNSRDDYWKK